MDDPSESYLPLSALQHLLYCERQCALIHVERLWVDNRLTAEGNLLHAKVHEEVTEGGKGVRLARGLPVVSDRLRLIGQCDVVEFHAPQKEKTGGPPARWSAVVPVEYKRGRPKSHEADQIQLCAQGLCLEEMLNVTIPGGALFYGEPRRRTAVSFTPELRGSTLRAVERLHLLLASGQTPMMDYRASLCRGCSLLEACMPRRKETPRQAKQWFEKNLLEGFCEV